jgi:hypothetical protein
MRTAISVAQPSAPSDEWRRVHSESDKRDIHPPWHWLANQHVSQPSHPIARVVSKNNESKRWSAHRFRRPFLSFSFCFRSSCFGRGHREKARQTSFDMPFNRHSSSRGQVGGHHTTQKRNSSHSLSLSLLTDIYIGALTCLNLRCVDGHHKAAAYSSG